MGLWKLYECPRGSADPPGNLWGMASLGNTAESMHGSAALSIEGTLTCIATTWDLVMERKCWFGSLQIITLVEEKHWTEEKRAT